MFFILLIVCVIACFLFFVGNSKIKGGFGTKLFYTLIAAPLLTIAIFAIWYLTGVLSGTVILIFKIASVLVFFGVIALVLWRLFHIKA